MHKINKFILDTLFPIHCLFCGKENFWLCTECFAKIPLLEEHVCPVCEKVQTPDGQTCIACKKKAPLDGLMPATTYAQSGISQIVHLFKYRFIQDLGQELGKLLVKKISHSDLPLPDLIIPIPLHPRRLRWRGFNQAQILANHVGKNLLPGAEIEIAENILIRKRYTSPQMEIKNHKQRQQNIDGAFALVDPEQVAGKTILLIDDITTTGSTIFECARVLKEAGAKYVFASVIARQEMSKH